MVMDDPNQWKPGKGLRATPEGAEPVEVPHLDDAMVRLVTRNLLIGGMPGSGKTGLINSLTVHAALDPDGTGAAGPAAGTDAEA
ncbi:hypothetical protein EV385_2460 [Krasilnikovia cinnamomea]|uniref:Uncharacterized protein n=2 Tax=Krasilnikovia cinnamomea TaxID=349313 RepID=A0A4Q7ZIK9_9ACTN|nr:hypothetical protein EV385_2460 [Krasilnikovia cinnamomea]